MSGQPAKHEGDLTFVITTNPSDRTSAANKRRVRSIAALKSWPERRKKTFDNVQTGGSQGGFVLEPPGSSTAAKAPKSVKRKRKATEISTTTGPAIQPRQGDEAPLFERTYLFRPSKHNEAAASETEEPEPPTKSRKTIADGKTKQATVRASGGVMLTPPASPTPTPLAMVPNEGKAEPFACYPVPYRPWFDRILHHMMTVFAPRGWPALKITNSEGLRWEWFMTQHALCEPALFYVRLLFASGDLIRLKVISPEISHWLQAQAINSINDALSDPERATSDPLILAVGRIALHEAFYGNKEAANVMHRPAQRRMIQMRGGMKALPFPDLVKRLMRWADNVMSIRSGTERMLEDEEENKNYSMEEQVDVLEQWVPTAGQEMRKKIKISDLLT
ncbi:hypothetical protein LTR09_004120 [Extremus antarcticus]|uniref:Uncharacterized protein n=1 Tax=Extremus antarcticus TaxID=702011 RepID=A0AAJ0GD58_9PEZI|nr:hypothetical protein LTR09_004120 [Extremus antarcticus]